MDQQDAQTDDDLMAEFQGGSVAAFEELVRRYQARLTVYAETMTADGPAADDVAQETFVRVFEQRREYVASGHFRAWIYKIARNLCVDRFREPALFSLDVDVPLLLWSGLKRTEDVSEQLRKLEESEQLARLGREARRLPGPMRDVVLLRYYHGLKTREIADVIGCPVGTVKSRLHYALERLQRMVSR